MNDTEFDLQLFASGDAVMGTDAYINANTGSAESYGSGGLSPEMKTFYERHSSRSPALTSSTSSSVRRDRSPRTGAER